MKALLFIKLFFATIGGICLAAAAYLLLSEIDFKRNAVDINGVVVNYRGNGIGPTYAYEFPEGVRHRTSSHSSSSEWSWMDGDTLPIQVDRRDPAKSQIVSFVDQWFAGTLMGIFGAIFGGIGFGMIYYRIRKDRSRKYLLDSGIKIQAQISSVGIDESVTMNGRSPFVVHAEALIDGEIRLFDSDSIWFNPAPYLKADTIDVYYDARNPGSYYVDLSGLPKLSE
jgi:hypothetical protein